MKYVDEFRDGAIGLSYGLAYSPACFSSTDELIDVAHEAADAHAFVSFHMRDEGDQLLEAMEESFEIGRRSGAAACRWCLWRCRPCWLVCRAGSCPSAARPATGARPPRPPARS